MTHFRRPPLEHQKEIFERTKDLSAFALFWEQGCTKTAPTIHTFAYKLRNREVDCLLLVAPPGVERNWISDEFPKDFPEDLMDRTRFFRYQAKKASTKAHAAASAAALKWNGPVVVAITYDSFMTKAGKNYVWKLLQKRKVLYVLDESHHIKTPGAKRTKSILASGRYAAHRRILTGTPSSGKPFDVYSQVKFLDETFWVRHGLGSYQAFKQYFGVWLTREECLRERGYDPGFDKLIEFKNLETLNEWLSEISDRKLKEQVVDLPPKLYSKRYFEMSPEQERLYKRLRDQYELELEEGVEEVELAIVRLLRLQQIACGYIQSEEDEPVRLIGKNNPRLELLKEIVDGLSHPAIIWSRFTKDIDQICEALGDRCTRYDGSISEDVCFNNQDSWKTGKYDIIAANPAKGKEGLTWHRAKTVIYYSNSFKLIDRLQSEDRAHRIGMDQNPVNYIDIEAVGTVDSHIIRALRNKFDIASTITGDSLREWI